MLHFWWFRCGIWRNTCTKAYCKVLLTAWSGGPEKQRPVRNRNSFASSSSELGPNIWWSWKEKVVEHEFLVWLFLKYGISHCCVFQTSARCSNAQPEFESFANSPPKMCHRSHRPMPTRMIKVCIKLLLRMKTNFLIVLEKVKNQKDSYRFENDRKERSA